MTVLDYFILPVPALLAGPFFLFGGLKYLIAKLGNPDMAIGLFGAVLCFTSVLLFILALSPSGKEAFSGYIQLLLIVGVANALLVAWELMRSRTGGSP